MPLLLKFGLARRLQLSLAVPFLAPVDAAFGPGDFSAGIKIRLVEHAGLLGDFAILPALKLPTGSERQGRGTGSTDLSLLLISSHALGPVALDLNGGISRRSGDGAKVPKTATVWTISLGGPAVGGLGWVAEVFGYPRTRGPAGSAGTIALLAGPTYRVASWLTLDAGGIVPLTGPQPKALYLGVTWNAGRYWPSPGGLRRPASAPGPNLPRGDLIRSGR